MSLALRNVFLSGLVSSVVMIGCASASADDNAEGNAALSAPGTRRDVSSLTAPADGKLKVLFLDADSTLRISKAGAPTANTADEVLVLPFAAGVIAKYEKTHFVAIVSNQGGISAGKVTAPIAEAALLRTASLLNARGANVKYVDYAPGGTSADPLRKPNVGMADELEKLLKEKCGKTASIDKSASLMIGDAAYKRPDPAKNEAGDVPPPGEEADDFSNSDRLFAENFGVKFEQPKDAFGWIEYGVKNLATTAELTEFLKKIRKTGDSLQQKDPAKSKALIEEAEAIAKLNSLTL